MYLYLALGLIYASIFASERSLYAFILYVWAGSLLVQESVKKQPASVAAAAFHFPMTTTIINTAESIRNPKKKARKWRIHSEGGSTFSPSDSDEIGSESNCWHRTWARAGRGRGRCRARGRGRWPSWAAVYAHD